MRGVFLGVLAFILIGVGLGAPAAYARPDSGPSVSARLSSTSGPLHARPLSLKGRHLGRVGGVRFGKASATRLRHLNARTLAFRAPARRRPGTVAVRVRVGRQWALVAHYTYVARPSVQRLSRHSSAPTGGGRLVIHGTHLATQPTVRLGSTAVPVVSHSARAVTVVVPAGVPGAANVVVRTPGGASAPTRGARFSYVLPSKHDVSDYAAADGAATGTGVEWVSGGADPARPTRTAGAPWIVSIAAGTDVPAVGTAYFLPPGNAVYPSGLTGTVSSVAAQQDGSTRLTITPGTLSDTLAQASVDYSDGAGAGSAAGPRTAAPDADFQHLDASAFDCEKDNGGKTSFSGELGLHFENLSRNFSWSITSPHVDAYITGAVVTYGKITAGRAMSCKLKPAWVNAHRKVFFLGDSGVTLSFGPAAEFEVSVGGTVSLEQTTHFMYGLAKYGTGPTTFYKVARQDPPQVKGSVSLSVGASAGLSVQIGILDRVGVQLKPELFVDGSLSAETGTPPRVCASVDIGVKLTVDGFLDLWFKRWETSSGTLRIDFGLLHKCTGKESDVPPSTDPQITSSTLRNATIGKAYSVTLTTADDRLGAWHLQTSLPPGLTLSSDGVLSGTPDGGIGDNHPEVVFVDAQGRTASATLLLRVLPDRGLGGGDLQATLTWSSAMDLDLHAIEPDGNEIYYNNTGPSDNGGELDHDANAGCNTVDPSPAENIHWPAPVESGVYQLSAQVYDTCGVTDLSWHLVVRVRGAVVIDQSGSGTSDWFQLNYSASTGAVKVLRVRPGTNAAVGKTPARAKTVGNGAE